MTQDSGAAGLDADVIVVGAGIAGCVVALRLAQAGRQVILLDRGAEPGAKNMSGGVLYTRALEQAIPGFLSEAPVERRITRHVLGLVERDACVSLDYADPTLASPVNAVTVLRAKLDPWLASRCEDAGALVMLGIRVDGLLTERGRAVGVRSGHDELRAHAVVAADGVNSFLARDAGVRPPQRPDQLALGIKSVLALPSEVIEDRFHCAPGEGSAHTFVGACTQGLPGGGFLYTNTDSLSVGIVVRLDALAASGIDSAALHDAFLKLPAIAPLIRGAKPLEYGSHLTLEDGPRLARLPLGMPGLLLVGDAAGLTLNTGLTLRGMDLAAASAIAAAATIEAALAASEPVDPQRYRAALDPTPEGEDLRTYSRAASALANPRLYGEYGRLATGLLHHAYALDGSPRRPLLASARAALRDSGLKLSRVARDALDLGRAL